MNLYPFELEVNHIQTAVLAVLIIWRSVVHRDNKSLPHRLFVYGLFANITMNAHWLTSLFLDVPENNLIFKASDAATISIFLFWISMLGYDCKVDFKSKRAWSFLPVLSICFTILNVVFWNLWNLNIVINTLWAIPILVFTYLSFYLVDSEQSFPILDRVIMMAAMAVLLIFEIIMYCVESESILYIFSDWICVVAWAVLIILFCIRAFRDKGRRTVWLLLARMFSLFAEYLSDGIRYSLFMLIETIILAALILLFREKDLEKEVIV